MRVSALTILALGLFVPAWLSHGAPAPAGDADLSAVLLAQTQAFSDAGQRHDRATMDRLLDPAVVFTNETGEIGTKADLLEGTGAPAPPNPNRGNRITHWAMTRQGPDLATGTFIDEVTQTLGGQILTLHFQSTETWAKRPGGWKMIVSHTMNVVHAPKPVALPAALLDDYAGTYHLGDALTVTIARAGDGLNASTNGAAPVRLEAELRDVLFTPGAPNVRRIFQRNAAGRVTGYVNRRDGEDLVLTKGK